MQESMKRILIIEDDPHIAEGIALNLTLEEYEVKVSGNGIHGLQEWKQWCPHLIVLDLMLPDINGMEVLKNIRLEDERLPILILSAKGDSSDKIAGFVDGVDDYMTKPFNLEEFLLRIKRLLTREQWQHEQEEEASLTSHSTEPPPYRFGTNTIDFTTGLAQCRSGTIQLTEQEIKLLKLFIVNKGKPLSRSRLLEIGWGYSKGTSTRTVDNYIVRLRRYFEEDAKNPRYFKSRRSLGYIFDHE
ncbi:MAG: response regulator transcription factor [Proteobacteria bacterium]|nr:response regulator transcription factor [Pseudomonadota bacterium]MBU1056782.1 response regulator transcription factor [Pseudomonadota bacterium]